MLFSFSLRGIEQGDVIIRKLETIYCNESISAGSAYNSGSNQNGAVGESRCRSIKKVLSTYSPNGPSPLVSYFDQTSQIITSLYRTHISAPTIPQAPESQFVLPTALLSRNLADSNAPLPQETR